MKKTLLLVLGLNLFCFIKTSAQRFGIDAGWFYSINNLKLYDETKNSLPVSAYTNIHLKQFYFPDLMFRPYVRLNNSFKLVSGVDLLKFSYDYISPGYNTGMDYIIFRVEHREAHIPVMLSFNYGAEDSKFVTHIYAGAFYRMIYEARQWSGFVTVNGTTPDLERAGLAVASVVETKNKYLNFIIGLKENFNLKPWFQPFIDIHLKGMTGYSYFDAGSAARFPGLFLQVKNPYSINFSIGFSFQTPKKGNTQYVNPLRE